MGKKSLFGMLAALAFMMPVSVFAQEQDTAFVPFLVNVDAKVKATLGTAVFEMSVEADKVDTLKIIVEKGSLTSISRQTIMHQKNTPALISDSRGKVSLNLPAHSYKEADISLYSLNGKRILRTKADASQTHKNISHQNLVAGVYLLSVKGANGQSFSNRLTHRGGNFNINVAFGNEDILTASPGAVANAALNNWTIIISAAEIGYADSSYTFSLRQGVNDLQAITLRDKDIVERCDCIMDTLKGEWSWARMGWSGIAYNGFKSILKILNQNEDSSINYQVFVEDTLFYDGSFQIQGPSRPTAQIRYASIKLPHYNHSDNWTFGFYHWDYEYVNGRWETVMTEDVLCFMGPHGWGVDGLYYYQKIRKD